MVGKSRDGERGEGHCSSQLGQYTVLHTHVIDMFVHDGSVDREHLGVDCCFDLGLLLVRTLPGRLLLACAHNTKRREMKHWVAVSSTRHHPRQMYHTGRVIIMMRRYMGKGPQGGFGRSGKSWSADEFDLLPFFPLA